MSGMEDTDEGVYKGNEYRTYRKAISAINSKYNGTAKWGVLQTGNIIDLRAAFIISRGIKVSARDKDVNADNELAWATGFCMLILNFCLCFSSANFFVAKVEKTASRELNRVADGATVPKSDCGIQFP